MKINLHVLKPITLCVILVSVVLFPSIQLVAQQGPPEVAKYGYADTIFVNGRVLSMDDYSRSTEVGNIYQAIAIKNDIIMKLGTSDEVEAVAGPDTQIFDMKAVSYTHLTLQTKA